MKHYLDKYPSLIPPDYKARVLARLLPPESAIEQMSRAELIALSAEKAKLEKLIESDPVRFFQPNPGGQYAFLTCDDPQIKGKYFFAGNKTGKTTGAAILAAERMAGLPLWGRDYRTTAHPTPTTGFIYCEDFATHEQTIIPTFLSWCPHKYLSPKAIGHGATGTPDKIYGANGTVIYLRTYDQGYLKAEGKDYDWGWCDEPPPRDIFTAIWRGLVARNGEMWIAATLLSQQWLYDEMGQSFAKVFDASMYENIWLPPEARKNYEAMLSEDEKQIRIYGKPSRLSGVIYPGFKDAPPFVVPQREIPWKIETERPWPVIMGVDPHERKPLYVEWAYLTPDERVIWFDWMLVNPGPLSEIKRDLHERELSHVAPTKLVVMDPNRGTAQQIGETSWQQIFEDWGYDVQLGMDNIETGHAQVREMLAGDPPRMQWMEACSGARKGSPVYQMCRYSWQDRVRGSRIERDLKEKPNESNKDFPDIHRYVACAKLDFKLLVGTDSGIVRFSGKVSGPQENPYVPSASSGRQRIDPNADAGALLERFGASNHAADNGRNTSRAAAAVERYSARTYRRRSTW